MAVAPDPVLTLTSLISGAYNTANVDSRSATIQDPTLRNVDDSKDIDIIKIYNVSSETPPVGIFNRDENITDVLSIDIQTTYGSENNRDLTVTGREHIVKVKQEIERIIAANRSDPTSLPSGSQTYATLRKVSNEDFSDEQRFSWRYLITVEIKIFWRSILP